MATAFWVASVLGADTDNGKGMAGVTWGGYVVPIKSIPRRELYHLHGKRCERGEPGQTAWG